MAYLKDISAVYDMNLDRFYLGAEQLQIKENRKRVGLQVRTSAEHCRPGRERVKDKEIVTSNGPEASQRRNRCRCLHRAPSRHPSLRCCLPFRVLQFFPVRLCLPAFP